MEKKCKGKCKESEAPIRLKHHPARYDRTTVKHKKRRLRTVRRPTTGTIDASGPVIRQALIFSSCFFQYGQRRLSPP